MSLQVKRHMKKFHRKERTYKCDLYGKSFPQKRTIEKHISAIHEGIKCDTYNKSFTQ